MSEWWTYRPSDFLMFAPRTYWRLFELHNEAWWPAQLLLVLLGLSWMWWAMRRRSAAMRAGAVGLAVVWAFVALAFLLPRYAPIHAGASSFAVVFLAQALALVALALRADLHAVQPGPRQLAGVLLCAWALLGHPLLAPAFGRPWLQSESFGLTPDPTSIATLGVLLLCISGASRVTRWLQRLLWVLATTWCVVSMATLWTMGSAQGWVVLVAVLVALVAAASGRRRLAFRS